MKRLLESLAIDDVDDFRRVYEEGIEARLQRGKLIREADWSESIAVGDRLFAGRRRKLCLLAYLQGFEPRTS